MTTNTKLLKELIYNKLNNSGTLQTLLGGTGHVRHENPMQFSEYPLVVYNINSQISEPKNYNVTQGSNITHSRLIIQSYSNNTDSAEADSLDDCVYGLFHGQMLSASGVQVYSCYRANRTALYDSDVRVWSITSKYDLFSATT